MKETELIGGKDKEVHSNDRTFPVLERKDMTNWVCFMKEKIIMMQKIFTII